MTMKLYISKDSTSLAVGADKLARAVEAAAQKRGLTVEIVRTGSRGAYWLEPMVEIERDGVRYGYGPLAPEEVEGVLAGGDHAKALGPVDEIDWLRQQQRLIYARCGVIDPLSLDDYEKHGGGKGLKRAIALGGAATVKEVLDSGLRG
ncbi:MAG: formate dehydrogenase, partial [Pseudomonadota bacterium]|nr:formate dehydrogenase [Pseudomonadota bacterium]